jgi:hypothetical protein
MVLYLEPVAFSNCSLKEPLLNGYTIFLGLTFTFLLPPIIFAPTDCRFFFILVNKINKYSKLATSLLTFTFIARPEFQTRVRGFFFNTETKEKKNLDPNFKLGSSYLISISCDSHSPLSPITPLPSPLFKTYNFFPQIFRSNSFLLQFINCLRETFYR